MARTLLITGAAGRIGQVLATHLTGRYKLVLADLRHPEQSPGSAWIRLDVADLGTVRASCQGIDTVIHLAAGSRPDVPWETLLPSNVVGTYNVFQAARDAGCRRVVFASSIHAVLGYPPDVLVRSPMPAWPRNLYGATKVWGETLARLYADQGGPSCICLRLGWVKHHQDPEIRPDAPWLAYLLTDRDLVRLVLAAIEAPDTLRFGIFHGLSDNRRKQFDITDARAVLGYEPEDDASELARAAAADHQPRPWNRIRMWLRSRSRLPLSKN